MTALEIRSRIIEAVSKNGGHLASSLGAVELAMALAETFDPAKDRVVWDVGHQAYAWKILTGRAERFDTLRKLDGLSGFPNPMESPCDAAIAGHAGVAISIAEGLAAARDRKGTGEHVVAVIGDSSICNGTSFEALNNCENACSKVIVVLNDNEMSISKPTGSFSRYLGRLIAGSGYNRVKAALKSAERRLHLTFLHEIISRVKGYSKRMLMHNAYFELMGFRYIGPVDGHDVKALKTALEVAKGEERSVILHVVTQKGRGYAPAVKDPTKWHGVGPFIIGGGAEGESRKKRDWSAAFGAAAVAAAERDARVVALTAAMKDGTELADFAARFPDRFIDAGISESHLMAYAAGLAAGGMRPVVALYSTFLQRAIDQVVHDVCISRQPVVICVDRAGVVGADGATHQGVFDIAMLKAVPNLTICQPKDEEDLKELLDEALRRDGPTLIRYPRGAVPSRGESAAPGSRGESSAPGSRGESAAPGSLGESAAPVAANAPRLAIWATGDWYGRAVEVARRVGGVAVHARYLKPFDAELLERQRAAGMKIVSLENGSASGGFGESIGADMRFGWPDEFIPHGSQPELEKRYGLDVDSIERRIREGGLCG